MKKNIFIMLAALSACFSSCDFLEVEKLGKSTIENYFADTQALEQAVNGIYNQTFSNFNSYQILYADIAGDLIEIESGNSTWERIYRLSALEDDETTPVGYIWKNNYETVINCNYIIYYTDTVRERESDSYTKRIDNALAQAYFLKALAELNLCLVYGQHYAYTADASHLGIIVMDGLPNLTAKYQRSDAAVSYKSIMDNLDQALSLIDDSAMSDTEHYATSYAIKALQARVALYMEDYSQAYQLSDEIISSGLYPLADRDDYEDMFMEPGTVGSEEILAINGYGQSSSLASSFQYDSHTLKLSSNLEDIFESRTDISTDIRYDMASYSGTFGVNKKYNKIIEYDESNRYYNIHLLRTSEQYLIRAEAAAKLGNSSQAESDVKTLRARAQGVDPSAISLSGDILDQIQDERAMELFTEGHRLFDLTRSRLGLSKPFLTVDNMPFSLSYPNDRFIQPIPYVELEANDVIQTNPVNTTQR